MFARKKVVFSDKKIVGPKKVVSGHFWTKKIRVRVGLGLGWVRVRVISFKTCWF